MPNCEMLVFTVEPSVATLKQAGELLETEYCYEEAAGYDPARLCELASIIEKLQDYIRRMERNA